MLLPPRWSVSIACLSGKTNLAVLLNCHTRIGLHDHGTLERRGAFPLTDFRGYDDFSCMRNPPSVIGAGSAQDWRKYDATVTLPELVALFVAGNRDNGRNRARTQSQGRHSSGNTPSQSAAGTRCGWIREEAAMLHLPQPGHACTGPGNGAAQRVCD